MSNTVEYRGSMIPVESVVGGPPPKVGDDIYVRTSAYISHGEGDFHGGLWRVAKGTVDMSAGKPTWFISVEESYSTRCWRPSATKLMGAYSPTILRKRMPYAGAFPTTRDEILDAQVVRSIARDMQKYRKYRR